MPLPPWLSTLPKAARVFYPIAVKGIHQGLSANTILTSYKAAGPGIRRTLGLEVVRELRDIKLKATAFRGLHLDRRPDILKIPRAETKILRKFSFNVEFQGLTSGGKSVLGHVTVVTDDIISRRQAEAEAAEYLDATPETYGIETVEKVQLAGIKKSPLHFS